MYRNLEAEMARRGVSRKDISKCLKIRYATVIDKMKGRSAFSINEVFKLKEQYFPGLSVEYLFDPNTSETESEVKR